MRLILLLFSVTFGSFLTLPLDFADDIVDFKLLVGA